MTNKDYRKNLTIDRSYSSSSPSLSIWHTVGSLKWKICSLPLRSAVENKFFLSACDNGGRHRYGVDLFQKIDKREHVLEQYVHIKKPNFWIAKRVFMKQRVTKIQREF